MHSRSYARTHARTLRDARHLSDTSFPLLFLLFFPRADVFAPLAAEWRLMATCQGQKLMFFFFFYFYGTLLVSSADEASEKQARNVAVVGVGAL